MWVWVNFGSWWWTGKPGMLQFMGLQSRTLTNWTEQSISCKVPGYMSYKLESRLLGEISRTWNAQMWKETISCHINLEEMPQPSPISHLQIWMRAPQTMIQRVLPPTAVIAEELEECKNKVSKETQLAKDSWSTYERNEFSEPRGLQLPTHRRLNSLIPNLWWSDCCFPLLQTYIAWLPPCLLENAFSELLRYCLLGLES